METLQVVEAELTTGYGLGLVGDTLGQSADLEVLRQLEDHLDKARLAAGRSVETGDQGPVELDVLFASLIVLRS